MKNCRIILNVFFVQFFLSTGFMFESRGQNDNINGIWSGTVKMKQEYKGELGHSVLEITITFSANVGNGSMKFEAQWKAPFNSFFSCSGSGSAVLHELSMSEEDNTYYSYYIAVIGPDYTCSRPDEDGQNKKDITISDKVLATNLNILSGTKTETVETGTGPTTTTLSWHLTRSTVGDVELIVTPDKYDDWLPEPGMNELTVGSVMNISLKLQARGGGSTTKKAKAFELKLSNTSNEPGITINFPLVLLDTTMPDLRFLVQSNAVIKDEKFQSLEINCPNGCQSGQAKLGSYDGGGWTILTAEAILTDNTRIKGMLLVSGGEMDIRIPKRDPNSKIGEAWLKKYNNPGEMDDIEKSRDNKNDGDGFTAYEEYRGVIAEGKFKRLNPTKKEVGIQATQTDFTLFSTGINWFKNASDLEIIRFDFDRDEIAGTGQLNINNKSAHDYDQFALYLLNGGLPAGVVGKVYTKNKKPNIPAQVISVVADWNRIQSAFKYSTSQAKPDPLKFTLSDYLAQTVAHELGHAVNVGHHGRDLRLDHYDNTLNEYVPYTVNSISDNIRIFNRRGQLITDRPYTLFSVGDVTGSVEGGDLSCMLNYYPYYNWGYSRGSDGAHIYNQEPLIALGKIYCKSSDATDFNTTQLYFGKAAKGNCLSQIKLK